MITTGSILLGVALLLLAVLFIARPFFVAHYRRQEIVTERQALQAQKEALLEQIRTLDFDHETGKLPDEVYRRQRATLVVEAAALLQRLDQLQHETSLQRGTNGSSVQIDDEIEAAIARLRRVQTPQPSGNGGSAGQQVNPADGAAGSRHKPETAQQATSFCSQCGEPHDAGDNFCAFCGRRLA